MKIEQKDAPPVCQDKAVCASIERWLDGVWTSLVYGSKSGRRWQEEKAKRTADIGTKDTTVNV